MKRILNYSLILLCALLLISCHRDPTAQTHTVYVLSITPRLESNDEFANAIDAFTWRFDVSADRGLSCNYELQEDGKSPVAFGGMGLAPVKSDQRGIETTMLVGIAPLGKSLSEADQISGYTWRRRHDNGL